MPFRFLPPMMLMAKNYYAILGILPSATSEDIRDAYRRRAKELHPDHYGENSTPFLEVQEAYKVLGNPAQRRSYDRRIGESRSYSASGHPSAIEILRPRRSGAEPLRPARGPAACENISLRHSFRTSHPSMEEIFDRIWSNFSPMETYRGERLQNLCLEIVLSPEEAQRGGRFQILVPAQTVCLVCGGRGSVGYYECFRCMGSGTITEDMPVEMEFAPGISDGYQKAVSLDLFGIQDVYLTLLFRIGGHGEMEEL